MTADNTHTTVVVVGAGLSGLTAARDLHRRGVDVIVLEAADRLGGRAMSETTTLGSRVDLGGQWIGHDHHRVMALATEFGLTRYPMHTGSLPTIVDGARRLPVTAPPMLAAALLLGGFELLSRIGTPAKWNATTVDAWLRRVPGRSTRRLLQVLASISWTADLDRMSIHAAANMVRHQGGLRTMLSTRGGAQESLLVEGAGTLADRLAAELGPRVRLGHRVESIVREEDDRVRVHTSAGVVGAVKVIVTVPPPLTAQIAFPPPLPPERADIAHNTYMGSVYKAIAVYERPFWRQRGGGEIIALDNAGRAVFDTTAPGGPGHLCILVAGPEARELDDLSPAGRRSAVLGSLTHRLGDEVLEPADWHEKSWHRDECVGGGYTALPVTGSTAGILPLPATPVGDIHWAGTETARDHAGYLEGAIDSGLPSAREVFDALR